MQDIIQVVNKRNVAWRSHPCPPRSGDYSNRIATTNGIVNVWRVTTRPRLADGPFQLGVASGDPTSTGGVLWTRLAPRLLEPEGGMDGQRVVVTWEVADDDSFRTVVEQGLYT